MPHQLLLMEHTIVFILQAVKAKLIIILKGNVLLDNWLINVPTFAGCSRYLKASASTFGVFSSVGFPFYPLETRFCSWRLTVPVGHLVKLSFKVFDSPSNDDRVIVSDGTEYDSGTVIGSYCSPRGYFFYDCKAPVTVYSVGRYMWVQLKFKTRSWRPDNDGVSMYFTAVLPGKI